MQLVIANWRLAVERTPRKKLALRRSPEELLERQVQHMNTLRRIEAERRQTESKMLLQGVHVQLR